MGAIIEKFESTQAEKESGRSDLQKEREIYVSLTSGAVPSRTRILLDPSILTLVLTLNDLEQILRRRTPWEYPIQIEPKSHRKIEELTDRSIIYELEKISNIFLFNILDKTLESLEAYLNERGIPFKMKVTIVEDPEEPEWKIILIIIRGSFNFKDIDDRISFEDSLEHLVQKIIDTKKEKAVTEWEIEEITEAGNLISIILEDISGHDSKI